MTRPLFLVFAIPFTTNVITGINGFTTLQASSRIEQASTRIHVGRYVLRLSMQTSDKPTTSDKQTMKQSYVDTSFDPLQLAHSSSSGDSMAQPELSLPPEEDEQKLSLWAARGILLLVAAVWGTNFACVKYLNELCFHPPCNHPPSEFAFARFGIAALFSIPILLKQRRDVIFAGFECGLWIALGYVSQSMALATISAGECAFICSLTVVFVPLVATLLYGKPLKLKDLVAGAVAISGVAVLEGMLDLPALLGIAPAVAATQESAITAGSASVASSSVDVAVAAGPIAMAAESVGLKAGDLLALGQPVGFGFAFTRIEHYQEQFREVPNRVLTIAAAQCVMVGLLSFFWVLYDYQGVIPNFGYMVEIHRIATLAWTGIVTTLVAIYMEGIALQKASATDASIAFASEPVWASLFGFLLLGETLGFNAYVGGSIIMTACLVGALSDLKQEDSTTSHDET